jgi:LETM1 and EF-hand domain-containing protein 1
MKKETQFILNLKDKNQNPSKSKAHIIKKKLTIKEQLKHAWDHMKKSLIDVKDDTKLMFNLRKKGLLKNLPLNEFLQYKQIQKDILKFLPFSLFVLIPVGEVFLPIYLYLFPNATPSQFYSEKSVGQMVSAKVKIQRKAYEVLKQHFRSVIPEILTELQTEMNSILTIESAEERERRFQELDLKVMTHMAENWEHYEQKLKLWKLTVYEKECVLGFLFKDFVSGVNIINRLIRLPWLISAFCSKMWYKIRGIKKEKVEKEVTKPKTKGSGSINLNKSFHGQTTLNFTPISQFRNILLTLQIKHHIWSMKRQDRFLDKGGLEELNNCTKQQVFMLSKGRGFAHLAEKDEKDFLIQYWVHSESNKWDKTENKELLIERWKDWEFRFWMMVIRHNYQNHLV